MKGLISKMDVMTAAYNANIASGRYDRIRSRQGILGCGEGFTVTLDEGGGLRYTGENRWGQKEATAWRDLLSVACGPDYILGLCRDGSVLSAGRSRYHHIETDSWSCVAALACGPTHAAALLGNGQVLASGDNRYGQCDTRHWRDMADVCCGLSFTIGLRKDGGLVAAGSAKSLLERMAQWPPLAALLTDVEGRHVLGITLEEGRLLSTGFLPACTRKWKNLVYAVARGREVMAITATGRLLSSRKAMTRRMETLGKDYVACAAGSSHMAVLCRDGEVLSSGHNEFGQSSTTRWGKIFQSFETFSARRREDVQKKEKKERTYQQRLSEAERFVRRLSCGERLTACIQADGHVSATAGLRGTKQWRDVCALSCGSAHILALHRDGTVSADGNNVSGCCRVSRWQGVKAVLAGKYHSLGLCEDGHVLFAGWNIHEQGNVTDWQHIRLLRCTDTYTVGLSRDGRIYTSGKKLPFDPEALDMTQWSDLLDLAVSEHHMVGLRRDGRVVTVGDEAYEAALAAVEGTTADPSSWQGVRSIAVGDGFTVALCYGGHVLAAGRNDLGQCETGDWKNVVSVACGRTFTAGLLADGRVVTAGKHLRGHTQMLSTDEIGQAVMEWEKAETTGYEAFHTQWMEDVLALTCGPEHLVTVDRYGQVMADGLDLDGQCTVASAFILFRDLRQLDGFGIFTTTDDLRPLTSPADGEDEADPSAPHQGAESPTRAEEDMILVGETAPRELSALDLSGQAGLTLLQQVYINQDGCLGIKGQGDRLPAELSGKRLKAVACGLYHGVALTADGEAVTFGRVPEGQDLPALEAAARQMLSEEGEAPVRWARMACGQGHTAAVTISGRVVAVGRNEYGQCKTSELENVADVSCGGGHTVAMTRDGRALAVGDNSLGQCNVEDWSELVMIACGERHTVGLRRDGRVLAAGDNSLGQCRVDGMKNVKYIACLPEATLCVDDTGRVTVCGGTGEFNDRIAKLSDIAAVYPKEYRLGILTSEGGFFEA